MYEDDKDNEPAFNGKISEIPQISVDNFKDKNKMAYFLSHMHSDHTAGLFGNYNSSKLRDNGAKIYMSKESNTILSHSHWHYDNLEKIVEPLKTGFTYTIDLPDEESFQVTLIPVKHMVGAVMFLFKTKDKTILYTGDFVMSVDEVTEVKRLHQEDGSPITIDALYVDATFDNPDYAHFPTRESAHEEVVAKAEEWLTDEGHRLALYSNYQFGYDDLYRALYDELHAKIFVADTQDNRANVHDVYESLYGAENFTTNVSNSNSKIHMCKRWDIWNDRENHRQCGISESEGLDYLYISMSATRGCNYDPELDEHKSLTMTKPNTYYLCYQTHCSKTQLDYFINYFSPVKTVRFPENAVKTPTSGNTPYKRDRPDLNVDSDSVKRRLHF